MISLARIPQALLTVGVPVSRYFATKKPDKYIVWAEDSEADSVWADGKQLHQSIQGTIDYYTKQENDPNVKAIQDALVGVSFRLNSIQYEQDTGFIHYEWVWEIG